MRTGIFFGSTTGNTEAVAQKIAVFMGVGQEDVHNVANTAPSAVVAYDVLLLGSSTWGSGELQDDWYDFLAGLEAMDLKGKKIGLFGCGDESMSDTFCNAVGELYKRLKQTGATFIGQFDAKGYDYSSTEADVDGTIVGLLIDQVNHPELTDERVREWCAVLKSQI